MAESAHYFLVAGEPSGDRLGAALMAALRSLAESAGEAPPRFSGIGGSLMAAEGLHSIVDMRRLSLMGLAEVVPRIPDVLAAIRTTVEAVVQMRPDALVTIDVPDFSFRVHQRVRKALGPPERAPTRLVHYVAPQVWAWRAGRAQHIAGFLDQLLCLLPFEPPYFESAGLPAAFVGHPACSRGADDGDGPGFRAARGIPADARLVCLLPGSRQREVACHMPVFSDVVARLAERYTPGEPASGKLHVVVPVLDALGEDLTARVRGWAVPTHVVTGGEGPRYDAFAAADAALACSGTVALETALADLPTIITYRLNPLSWALLRRLVRARFAHLVNITADAEIVPEYLQERHRADWLTAGLIRHLEDEAVRQQQIEGCRTALAAMGRGGENPGVRAARAIREATAGQPVLPARGT